MRALIFIIETIADLFTFVLLLRFWLPWVGADFRNPIAQGILGLTSPLVNPVRRIVPAIGRVDTATVLIAFAVQGLTAVLVSVLIGVDFGARLVILYTIFELITLSLRLFMFAILIRIVLSWIAPQTYNPATALLTSLTDPILRPFRRLIPPLGGFDISPVFAIILLGAVSILVEDSRSLFM